MNLHEFQAKSILQARGVPVPRGKVAAAADEAAAAAREIGGTEFAVKAQILAGGRGVAGGVRMAASPDEVRRIAGEMLGTRLVTTQTGAAGRNVRRVYVEQAVRCGREVYLAILVDRNEGRIALIGAERGGDDVEDRLQRDPESLQRLYFDGIELPDADSLHRFADSLGLGGGLADGAVALLQTLGRTFVELDASLIEVNPLCVGDGGLVVLDVKMIVDDAALFRHPDLEALRDDDETDAVELAAQRHDLNFVRMDGNIGVVVNGAGLALATNDILRDFGGAPANFMDIRTTAMSQQIARGIGLLLTDPSVKAILVNVHGGGMTSCDTVVDAIQMAMRQSAQKAPIVFRAAGQNAEHARWMMADRRIAHELATDISSAARRAVELARR